MKREVTSNYEIILPLEILPKVNIQVWEKEEGYFDITVNGKDFAGNLFENEIENNLEYLSSYINGCIDIKNGKDLFGIFS